GLFPRITRGEGDRHHLATHAIELEPAAAGVLRLKRDHLLSESAGRNAEREEPQRNDDRLPTHVEGLSKRRTMLGFERMLTRLVLLVAILSPGVAGAAPPSFKPDEAAPYFATGPAAEAAAKLRLEEWAAAAKLFEAYLKKHAKAPDHKQAQFLLAYCELK